MSRLIIFASYCFLIIYLASWSLSFSINYEKEKNKIRERLSNITDPIERENKLLQIHVEEIADVREAAAGVREEIGKLKAEKNYERAKRIKDTICPAMRTELEEFEQMHLPATKLSKADMIKDLKSSDPNFAVPSSIAKVEDLSYHYVSMRYILKNSKDQSVLDFKNHLYSKGLNDDLIARVAGIFYKKSSSATHNILMNMTLKEVEDALREYGINDIDCLTVAKTLYAVRYSKMDELD